MSDQGTAPLTLLGSNISYFTGKMENYLRLKQIPYRLESMQFPAVRKVLERELGVMQMPAPLPRCCSRRRPCQSYLKLKPPAAASRHILWGALCARRL